jgi:hypothetical protein
MMMPETSTIDDPRSPFAIAAAELRGLGITIARLPGEYRVNYVNGSEATAESVDTLDMALEIGRSLARARPPAKAIRRRRRRMTPKAYNRRLRKQHMRRLRARAKHVKPSTSHDTR